VQPVRNVKTCCSTRKFIRVHKSTPLVSVLKQTNTVYTTISCLSKIHLTYILILLVVSFLLAVPPITYTHSSYISSPIRVTCPAYVIFLGLPVIIIYDKEYKLCSFLRTGDLAELLTGTGDLFDHTGLFYRKVVCLSCDVYSRMF
jgi:hypothetical protein